MSRPLQSSSSSPGRRRFKTPPLRLRYPCSSVDLQIVRVLTSEPDQVNWYLMEAAYIALVLCGLFILTLAFICYRFATESIASSSELLTPLPSPTPSALHQETSLVLHQVNLRLVDVERELLKLTKHSLTNLVKEGDSPLVCPKHCVYVEAEVGKKRLAQKKLYVSPELTGSVRSPTLGRNLSLNLKREMITDESGYQEMQNVL